MIELLLSIVGIIDCILLVVIKNLVPDGGSSMIFSRAFDAFILSL